MHTTSDEFGSRVVTLRNAIRYKHGYNLIADVDKTDPNGRMYLQVEAHRVDAITGDPGIGRGGKAYLSEHMTDSEIVRLAFGLFLAYEEHEAREFFRYAGAQVFGPHIDVQALVQVAHLTDARAAESAAVLRGTDTSTPEAPPAA